jgi:hypothetical protein
MDGIHLAERVYIETTTVILLTLHLALTTQDQKSYVAKGIMEKNRTFGHLEL